MPATHNLLLSGLTWPRRLIMAFSRLSSALPPKRQADR